MRRLKPGERFYTSKAERLHADYLGIATEGCLHTAEFAGPDFFENLINLAQTYRRNE